MRSWLLEALLAPVAICPPAWRGRLVRAYLAAMDVTMPTWRQTVRRNLTLAGFPNPEWLMRANYAHYQRIMTSLAWQHRLDRGGLEGMLRVEGGSLLAGPRDRGMIVVSVHFGNWELGAHAKGLLYGPMLVPVRRSDWAGVDALLDRRRCASGNKVVDRRGASPAMLAHLRAGGDVGLMIDTRPDEEARVEVEFLSMRGWAGTTAARLCLASGAAVVCAHTLWSHEEGRYIACLRPAPALSGEVQADTRALLSHFEPIIRRHPEQYLWMHDRWGEPRPFVRRQRPPGAP